MTKERRLGRGLEALLGRPLAGGASNDPAWGTRTRQPRGRVGSMRPGRATARINVYEIESNPFQPRRDFDEAAIAELCREHQDPWHAAAAGRAATPAAAGNWWPANGGCGRRSRPAGRRCPSGPRGRRPADGRDRDRRESAAQGSESFGKGGLVPALSHSTVARRTNWPGGCSIDRSTIANLIRLLELPAAVQDAVRREAITAGHARAYCRSAMNRGRPISAAASKPSRGRSARPKITSLT